MGTILKFVAPGIHVVEVDKKDFANEGIEHDSVRVDVRENALVEVSEDAAEFLKESFKGQWKEATEKEAEKFRNKIRLATEAEQDEDQVEEKEAERAEKTGRGRASSGTETPNTRAKSTTGDTPT